MLNDRKIIDLIFDKELITPYEYDQIQPHSYDATLSDTILFPSYTKVELDLTSSYMKKGWTTKTVDESVDVPSLGFALASTREYFRLPKDIVGFVCGKSTIGRNGLQVENAGLIDCGFEGEITLELFNMAPWPITLKKNMSICQIYFFNVDSPMYKDYSQIGHYNKQREPTLAVYSL